MIYKRCNICHKRIAANAQCDCYERKLSREKPSVNSFYNTQLWYDSRTQAICKTFGLDIYSLYILHKIETGRTVHHIVPLELSPQLKASQDNLIYLTESNHRTIHELYKTNYIETAKLLSQLLVRFKNDFTTTEGGGQKCFFCNPENTAAQCFKHKILNIS